MRLGLVLIAFWVVDLAVLSYADLHFAQLALTQFRHRRADAYTACLVVLERFARVAAPSAKRSATNTAVMCPCEKVELATAFNACWPVGLPLRIPLLNRLEIRKQNGISFLRCTPFLAPNRAHCLFFLLAPCFIDFALLNDPFLLVFIKFWG